MNKNRDKLHIKLLIAGLLVYIFAMQNTFAEASLSEYECLHLNIGLFALLETENTHFQRRDNLQYDSQGVIAQALSTLKSRGQSCSIKPILYVEAAEYSLHFRQLDDASYFLQKARLLTKTDLVK